MRPYPPLRRSLALRFALAALVPILVASAVFLHHLTVGTLDDIATRNQLLAHAVAGQVKGLLREPVVALQALREMLPGVADAAPAQVEAHLDAAARGAPLLEAILLVGAGGRVEAVGLGPAAAGPREDLRGIDIGHQPFVRHAVASGAPAWSDTHYSLVGGGLSLSVCIPLGDGRVLLGSFDVGRLLRSIHDLPAIGSVAVCIVDRGGAIVAHPDPAVAHRRIKVGHLEPVRRGLAGEEVSARVVFLGRDTLASAVRIADTGWLALVLQETADAYHQPLVAGLTIVGALLAAAGLALLFALTQSRRIAGPLAALAADAGRIAAGGYELRPAESGSREVHELAQGFARMAEAVQDRERRLREGEEKYRLLFENAGDAIFVAQDGALPFANHQTETLTGVGAETLRSTPWTGLVHPEDRTLLVRRHRARIAGEEVPSTATFRILRPDGQQRWVQLNSVRFAWEGRPATLNFARDVTDLKSLEAQAIQAQKLEAVGTLAGGVAHDFNNLLQAIQGSAELALMPGREEGANRQSLEQIIRAAGRGAELTRQLLTFSRKIESRRRPLDLNAEVGEVARLLGSTLPKMVRLELDLDPGLGTVSADAGQVQQLLMNLAVNASQAMSGAGVLRISTRAAVRTAVEDARPEIPPGRYAEVTVSDTGPGIGEQHRDRVFEPFFTTKEPGEGTGLGLSMVFGIVKAHEGHVWFESESGAGTTFHVLLPADAGNPPPAAHAPSAGTAPVPAAGRSGILVVDDESIVRDVSAEILGLHGYRVLTAPDGETALHIFRERRREIELVLLDLIMPGMGGRRCLEGLLALDPGVVVIVTSGYTGGGPDGGALPAGARGFVSKPFSVDRLLEAVRAATGAGGGPPSGRGETDGGRG